MSRPISLESTDPFEVGDPIKYFHDRAFHFSDLLGVTGLQINNAMGILINALGQEWLDQAIIKYRNQRYTPHHPITEAMHVAGESQIALMLELAAYIKVLANVPGLAEVITSLKDRGQFNSAFLQLAHAYRFNKLGVSKLMLEPSTDSNRKGDIYFEVADDKFIVECFHEDLGDPMKEFWKVNRITRAVFKMAKWSRSIFRVCIKLEVYLSDILSIELASKVRTLAVAAENHPIEQKTDKYHISAMKVNSTHVMEKMGKAWNTCSSYGECDGYTQYRLVTKEDVLKVKDGQPINAPGLSRVLFWYRRPAKYNFDERSEYLCSKLEEKLSQIRQATDQPERIVIAAVPEGYVNDEISPKIAESVAKRLLPLHLHTAGFILVQRGFVSDTQRHEYRGMILIGNSGHKFMRQLTASMTEIQNQDVLRELY